MAERKIQDDADYKVMVKKMNPLEKWVDTQANIGWSHFAIDNLKKLVAERLKTKSPIDEMINKATGYDKGLIKGFIINLRGHYKELVKNHRYLGEMEAVKTYKQKITTIDKTLKTILKDVKSVNI